VPASGGAIPGVAVSRAFKLGAAAPPLVTVNAVAVRNGSVTAELLGADGSVLPGFERSSCVPLYGDHASTALAWRGAPRAAAGELRVRFFLLRARLYGFTVLPPAGGGGRSPLKTDDDPPSRRYLLLDGRVVASVVGATLVLGKLEKEPRSPLLREDRPWEKLINSGYPNIFFDEQDKLYKVWYGCQTECPKKSTECPHRSYNYTPSAAEAGAKSVGGGAQTGSCYATSVDGLSFVKPALGAVAWHGSKENNLVMTTTADNGRGFLKDVHEHNASQRYKMFGQIVPFCLRNTITGLCVREIPDNASAETFVAEALGTSVSADGVHWAQNRSIASQVSAAGDASNQLVWDDAASQYVGITRIDLFSSSGQYREAAVASSRDFVSWSRAVEVLQRNATESGGKHPRQENSYIVFRPAGSDVWLALVTFSESPKVSWGRFVTELAWSADLLSWHRVLPGTPFIPQDIHNTTGAWDAFMTLAAAAPFVDPADGSRVRLYYVGTNGPWKSRRDNSIGLGYLPRDHWAGFSADACLHSPPAGACVGSVRTNPLAARRLELRVTARIEVGGWLAVAAQGPTDKGAARWLQSVRLNETATDAAVAWATGLDGSPSVPSLTQLPVIWQGQQLVLSFTFVNATIFGFSL
jgi:hypothetical protein